MPRYRMESLIRTMILNRCRRQRLGLRVESVELFAASITSLYARVENAEKRPTPWQGSGPLGLRIMVDRLKLSVSIVTAGRPPRSAAELAASVRRWSGRLNVNGSSGWYLGTFGGHALTVARNADLDRLRRRHLALDVVPEPEGDGRLAQDQHADDLGVQHLEHAETASEDAHCPDDRERDPERLAGRRDRVIAGHRASSWASVA